MDELNNGEQGQYVEPGKMRRKIIHENCKKDFLRQD